ncbi:MAG: helix-turn-helix domain-containing protein [Cyanobacteriota bacterium]|nr:helix-turn-helix domain-containing protein [Cyanobacteriota bacterium]
MANREKEEKLRELDEWIKSNPDSRELKRALAVKLVRQGASYEAIASLLKVSKSFISKWKQRYSEQGIKGLKLSYKGSKGYLSKSEKEATINWIKAQRYWDLSELECYLIEAYNVVFKSPSSYYELLREAQISWQKGQKKNPRKKPEEVK